MSVTACVARASCLLPPARAVLLSACVCSVLASSWRVLYLLPQRLRSFDCSHNLLADLPATLAALSELQTLDVSHNRLPRLPWCIGLATSLPASTQLGRLQSLTTINASCNQLRRLPESFGGLRTLTDVNVSSNKLETLPKLGGLQGERAPHPTLDCGVDALLGSSVVCGSPNGTSGAHSIRRAANISTPLRHTPHDTTRGNTHGQQTYGQQTWQHKSWQRTWHGVLGYATPFCDQDLVLSFRVRADFALSFASARPLTQPARDTPRDARIAERSSHRGCARQLERATRRVA